MTTIVYKNNLIAYESLLTHNGIVTDDDYDKRIISKGVSFFFVGPVPDYQVFISLYEGGPGKPGACAAAIIYDHGELLQGGIDEDDSFWKEPIDRKKSLALGSGRSFALGAIDMGASAYMAVKMAVKRDCYSGGRIRTFKVR